MVVKAGKKYPRNYFRVPQLFFNVPQLFLPPPQLFLEPPQLFAGSNRSSVSAGLDNTGPSTPGPSKHYGRFWLHPSSNTGVVNRTSTK